MGEDNVSDDFSWDEDTPPSPVSRASFADRESSTASSAPAEAGSSQRTLFSQFFYMGFSREMVERALKDNDDGDPEKILDTLTSNPPAPEASSSGPDLYSHFVRAGFPEKMVDKAIKQNDKGDAGGVLETLLAYSVVEGGPSDHEETLVGSSMLSDSPQHWDWEDFDNEEPVVPWLEDNVLVQVTATPAEQLVILPPWESVDVQEFMEAVFEKDQKLLALADMGYPIDEAFSAINRCGVGASFSELTDSICAARMAEPMGHHVVSPMSSSGDEEDCLIDHNRGKKRKQCEEKRVYDTPMFQIPNPMIGFGLPNETPRTTKRMLPDVAIGPPYFYFENASRAPKWVWARISQFLYGIEPEFVDSKYFSTAARKRGYIHNLPIHNRFPIRPIPPRAIQEALPGTKKWWPSWDQREKLNCLHTWIASAKPTEMIRSALANCGDDIPPVGVQKMVLALCAKWNLVWVGLNKVVPLEPHEIEMLLGFPKDHTRGISRTERYKLLRNSIQVDTVAYHLSVLKEIFPNGINVLSLFPGIGGAAVALHRLGIHIKVIVSVEISEINRTIIRGWWKQTKQQGRLLEIDDVQKLSKAILYKLISEFGDFDLIIGGSPCNNLTGSNRYSRDGLEGRQSSVFYDYYRILEHVKSIMGRKM